MSTEQLNRIKYILFTIGIGMLFVYSCTITYVSKKDVNKEYKLRIKKDSIKKDTIIKIKN